MFALSWVLSSSTMFSCSSHQLYHFFTFYLFVPSCLFPCVMKLFACFFSSESVSSWLPDYLCIFKIRTFMYLITFPVFNLPIWKSKKNLQYSLIWVRTAWSSMLRLSSTFVAPYFSHFWKVFIFGPLFVFVNCSFFDLFTFHFIATFSVFYSFMGLYHYFKQMHVTLSLKIRATISWSLQYCSLCQVTEGRE